MDWVAEREDLLAQLAGYLEELRDTGVQELYYAKELAPRTAPDRLSAPSAAGRTAGAAAATAPGAQTAAVESLAPSSLFRAEGNRRAPLVFIEAGDGFQGEPGQLLEKMVQAMGFGREEVCLLSFGAPSAGAELKAALLRALGATGPKAVVVLGEVAVQLLLEIDFPIASVRGTFQDLAGIPAMPTLHPEELVRDQSLKRPVWEDLQQVMRLLGKKR